MTSLREAAQQALEALDWIVTGRGQNTIEAAHANLRAALAEQAPVAWWHQKSDTFTSGNLVSKFAEWTPLYTAPQPAKRKPLTDEEIDDLDLPPSGTATVRDLVRLIERAHGIGEQE